MFTATRTAAKYTVEVHKGHLEVTVDYTQKAHPYNTFKVFDNKAEMRAWIDQNEKICKIMKVLAQHTEEMEGYSYFGSNPGIPEDEYDEVAQEIIKAFNL